MSLKDCPPEEVSFGRYRSREDGIERARRLLSFEEILFTEELGGSRDVVCQLQLVAAEETSVEFGNHAGRFQERCCGSGAETVGVSSGGFSQDGGAGGLLRRGSSEGPSTRKPLHAHPLQTTAAVGDVQAVAERAGAAGSAYGTGRRGRSEDPLASHPKVSMEKPEGGVQ